MKGNWKRVSKRCPCPVCQRPDYCTISPDGKAVKCMRVTSNRTVDNRDGSVGYLHTTPEAARELTVKALAARDIPRLTISQVKAIIKKHRADLNPSELKKFADSLGLSVKSVEAYGVGYDKRTGSFSFPMYDGALQPIGIRTRHIKGTKGCITGSRNGIFVPIGYEAKSIGTLCADPFPLLLLLPEGPTDAAAAFDLGFRAIGRPSNRGGAEMMKQLLKIGDRQEVVIVADHDETKWTLGEDNYTPNNFPFWPGWEGALAVADIILPVCGSLKVIKPPEKAKDLREWIQRRNHTGMFRAIVNEAAVVTWEWLHDPIDGKIPQVEVWKENLRKQRLRKSG